jgi:hypothetical protein
MIWAFSGHVAASLLSALAFRCLPFAVYALVSRAVALDVKFAVATLFAALILLCDIVGGPLEEVLLRAPLALLYFGGISLLVHATARSLRRTGRTVPLLAVATAYVSIPAVLVGTPAIVPTLVIGWEAMLAAYSFVREAPRQAAYPTRRDCLFFILVDPTLVWNERGVQHQSPASIWRGAARCGLGLATWGLQAVSAGLLLPLLHQGSVFPGGAYGDQLSRWTLVAIGIYLGHSGLASIQIGLMRVSGYNVGERYRYPFLARSPSDFWRRWNVYVGSWARHYLFLPAARSIPGAVDRRARVFGAVVGTFVAVGALHAFLEGLVGGVVAGTGWARSGQVLLAFGVFGVTFVSWESLARARLWRTAHRMIRAPSIRGALCWLSVVHVMCAMAFLIVG